MGLTKVSVIRKMSYKLSIWFW